MYHTVSQVHKDGLTHTQTGLTHDQACDLFDAYHDHPNVIFVMWVDSAGHVWNHHNKLDNDC